MTKPDLFTISPRVFLARNLQYQQRSRGYSGSCKLNVRRLSSFASEAIISSSTEMSRSISPIFPFQSAGFPNRHECGGSLDRAVSHIIGRDPDQIDSNSMSSLLVQGSVNSSFSRFGHRVGLLVLGDAENYIFPSLEHFRAFLDSVHRHSIVIPSSLRTSITQSSFPIYSLWIPKWVETVAQDHQQITATTATWPFM